MSSETTHVELLQTVLKIFPDFFFLADISGKILDCGGGGADLSLGPARRLVGKRFQDLSGQKAGAQIEAAIEKLRKDGKPVSLEYLVKDRAQEAYYEARLLPLSGKKFFVVLRNITERKKNQEDTKKTLALLESTLDSTTDGILVVDSEGKIIRLNRKFVQMWRIPDSIIAGGNDDQALAFVLGQLKYPEKFLEKVRELYATPDAESFDTLEFKDGRIFERYSQPHRVGGIITGRVWDFKDITEQKRLESTLTQSEKLSAIGQLAAGVAHEINNPLGVILGFAQTAKNKVKEGDALYLPVQSIAREALRCKELVQNLLTFSRTSNSSRKEEIELKKCMEQALSLIIAQARVKDVTVSMDLCLAPTRVVANANQIQQVVINLCNNAIDAMPKGGMLYVHTRIEGKNAEILVTDTGTGIPEEIRTKIFEPFFTTKEVGKGTGLGLSLVHEIVQQHGGNIRLESELGKGTTFVVSLPIA